MMEAGGCRAPVFESRGAVALWRLLVRRRFGRLAKECAFPFTWHLVPRLVHRAWPWHSGARSWSLTPAHCAFTYKHSGSASAKLRHRHIISRAHVVPFQLRPPVHRLPPRCVNPSSFHSNQLPAHPTTPIHHIIMADVDMADAPPAKTKTGKASAAEGDKKRFEVKKVSITRQRTGHRD